MTQQEQWVCRNPLNPRLDWGCSPLVQSDLKEEFKGKVYATRRECVDDTPCGGDKLGETDAKFNMYLKSLEEEEEETNIPLPVTAALADVRQLKRILGIVKSVLNDPLIAPDAFIHAFLESKAFPVWIDLASQEDIERMILLVEGLTLNFDIQDILLPILARRADSILPLIEANEYFSELIARLDDGLEPEEQAQFAQILTRLTPLVESEEDQKYPSLNRFNESLHQKISLGSLWEAGDELTSAILKFNAADHMGWYDKERMLEFVEAEDMPRSKNVVLDTLEAYYSNIAEQGF